jgi:hypothetical protein
VNRPVRSNLVRRGLTGVVLAVAAAAALAMPVAAREPVDPATLNPPPPAEFNPVCYQLGNGTQCTLAFSDPSVVDAPTGIVCDGVELLDSFTRSVVGTRAYDSDGNLLRRHFEESFVGSFTNPETGLVATYIGHDKILNDLDVPGDQSTGTSLVSGPITRVSGPDGRTIVMNVGSYVESPDGMLRESGPHAFFEYFELGDTAALQPLCDALD